MGRHDMLRSQRRCELPHDFEERFIVGDKNLDHVTELRDFGGRADEVLFRPWRSVPNKDLEPAMTQRRRDRGADDSEPDQANIFVFRTRHCPEGHVWSRSGERKVRLIALGRNHELRAD